MKFSTFLIAGLIAFIIMGVGFIFLSYLAQPKRAERPAFVVESELLITTTCLEHQRTDTYGYSDNRLVYAICHDGFIVDVQGILNAK